MKKPRINSGVKIIGCNKFLTTVLFADDNVTIRDTEEKVQLSVHKCSTEMKLWHFLETFPYVEQLLSSIYL